MRSDRNKGRSGKGVYTPGSDYERDVELYRQIVGDSKDTGHYSHSRAAGEAPASKPQPRPSQRMEAGDGGTPHIRKKKKTQHRIQDAGDGGRPGGGKPVRPSGKRRKKYKLNKKGHRIRRVICIILALLVALTACAFFYFNSMLSNLDKVQTSKSDFGINDGVSTDLWKYTDIAVMMKLRPEISVIIPVYNNESYLCDTLDSLLAQSFKDFEAIVINDGSSDGTEAIIDRYALKDKRIRKLVCEHRGVSGARNAGLEAAGGRYAAFLDGDDVLPENAYRDLYECAVDSEADLVVGVYERLDGISLHVTKRYEDNVGLDDVSINIDTGEFVFIVGPSGAGKSTFIKLILKEIDADEGSIIVNGNEVTTLSNRMIPSHRRNIGIVFQDFRLLANKTVFENVAFAMEITHQTARTIKRQVPPVLGLVGIGSYGNRYPDELSAGEQQRVAIARAIVNRPTVLIADEPTGNLDPDTAWEIMKLLERINENGTTILMVTHALYCGIPGRRFVQMCVIRQCRRI